MSTFSYVLRISGFAGLTGGFGVQLYTALLRDPIIYSGTQLIPGWMSTVSSTLLIGSLAVLLYSHVLDTIFKGWIDLVAVCALGGQWGVPIGVYLSATLSQVALAGLVTLVGNVLHTLVAAVMTITYLRRGRQVEGVMSSN